MGYELIHHRVTQSLTEFNQFEIKKIELRETLCYSVVKTHFCTVTRKLSFHFIGTFVSCSVLNKLTLLKFEIHMEELKKKYTPYTESERMSYIREYLSTSETKYQFAKRTGICRRLLILWLEKYHINDKVMNTEQPSLSKASDESLNELEKELAALRAENRKLQRALQEESLRHEACEELINLAESTYHIKVRKNSDAK